MMIKKVLKRDKRGRRRQEENTNQYQWCKGREGRSIRNRQQLSLLATDPPAVSSTHCKVYIDPTTHNFTRGRLIQCWRIVAGDHYKSYVRRLHVWSVMPILFRVFHTCNILPIIRVHYSHPELCHMYISHGSLDFQERLHLWFGLQKFRTGSKGIFNKHCYSSTCFAH
jgi:hypothetical protein